MLYPAPELPDGTPIENVRFSTRIRNAVTAVGWKTVGEIREASDATLLGLRDLGPGSVTSLHETLACRHAMVSDPWAKSRRLIADLTIPHWGVLCVARCPPWHLESAMHMAATFEAGGKVYDPRSYSLDSR